MKQYTNDKYLTDDNLDNFYYDNINGCIRKKNSNKIMRSKSTFGKPIIVINSKSIEQNRIVCKLNKISFSPTCKIEHIDGDINNLHVENLKIVPFSLCLSENENTELDIFKNDKYMPDMFKLYFYEPISGKVFNRKTNRQVKTLKNGYVRVSFLVNGVSIRISSCTGMMILTGTVVLFSLLSDSYILILRKKGLDSDANIASKITIIPTIKYPSIFSSLHCWFI